MRDRLAAAAALAFLLAAPRGAAQGLDWYVGGGATFPLADAGQRFDTGWNFQAGVGYRLGASFALRADFQYSEFDLKGDRPVDPLLDARHTLQSGSLSVVFQPRADGPVGFYALAGPGLYVRETEITRFLGNQFVVFCDPFLTFCQNAQVPIEDVLGRRSVTDFGVGVGAGLTFRLHGSARLYLESRWHYVWGDSYAGPQGSVGSNARYLPVTVGLTF